MPSKKQDEQFASHLPGVIGYHAKMLSDGVRNDLLYRAIKRVVNSQTNFLDVGAGSGVWAILAAKLGAKRVVAVEIEEALIPVIFKHAQENGVADRVEIVHGNIDDVKLKGNFDVIVCELFGKDAFGAEVVNSINGVRKRFLAPRGILIPQRIGMFAVPILKNHNDTVLPAKLDLRADFFRHLKLNYPEQVSVADLRALKFAGQPRQLVEIDFRTIQKPLEATEYSAVWKVTNISRINAFGIFQCSVLAKGLKLDSRDSKSWGFTKYNFEPFDGKVGEIRFGLTLDPTNATWSAAVISDPNSRPQTYSPIFAFTRVKMAHSVVPHTRSRPAKPKDKR